LDRPIDDVREQRELTAIGCVFLSIDRSTPAIFADSAECGGAVPLGRRSCPAERWEAGASDFLPLVPPALPQAAGAAERYGQDMAVDFAGVFTALHVRP
jgi:hypothetical protein